ncbi:hypothetical protein K2X83_00840, partial [Patescibacteria group bacterium]|nr:hypothetical protein [Patescibacteria group bacterium]
KYQKIFPPRLPLPSFLFFTGAFFILKFELPVAIGEAEFCLGFAHFLLNLRENFINLFLSVIVMTAITTVAEYLNATQKLVSALCP